MGLTVKKNICDIFLREELLRLCDFNQIRIKAIYCFINDM